MGDFQNEIIVLREMFEVAKDNNSSDQVLVYRTVLEKAIDLIFRMLNERKPYNASLLELINNDVVKSYIEVDVIIDSLHFVRIVGNNALHKKHIKAKQADVAKDSIEQLLVLLENKLNNNTLKSETIVNSSSSTKSTLSEYETRKTYIDTYLGEAGWEVVKPESSYTLSNGKKVKCGSVIPSKACCEVPVEGLKNVSGVGFCDYVLYGNDGKPLAIVEAKKTSVDPIVGLQQVKEYGKCMKEKYGYVPVLYCTNGYSTYVIDGKYPKRLVNGFHKINELEYLIKKRDIAKITDMSVNPNIAGRPYQKMAITKICERFNDMQRKGLLVMATGTGKTRVSIALVEVLLRNGWVKDILFLADRTSLVTQAFKNFRNLLPDMTFKVLSNKGMANEDNARITFSTHQTMINYIDAEDKDEYSIGRFDLIIIDEAHRSIFNKYGAIFNYFDALLVGLTATPKDEVDANTYQLFNCEEGEPNFVYSLEEAVKDQYLVPYKVKKNTTKLIQEGIKYKDLSIQDKRRIDLISDEPYDDESIISGSKLFKIIYNKDTCRKVIEELMEYGLKIDGGQKLGKTIIFAYNHKHAQLIVDTFYEMYADYNDYCQLIDNQVKNSEHLIEEFENNDNFRIAVSVDMLDTGIDVPSVLNLVFFKQVKSKIKFVQMIGRGTRLCEGLMDGKDKDHFLIFDYCGNFDYFDIKPDGSDGMGIKSITQKLYEMRLDLLFELQKIEHQSIQFEHQYYKEIKNILFNQTKIIKQSSTKVSVRERMDIVDKYSDIDNWKALSQLNIKEIKYYLTSLINSEIKEHPYSLSFDLKMLRIEYAYASTGSIDSVLNIVQVIRKIAKELLEYASIDEILNKANELKTISSSEFWQNADLEQLEYYRKLLRSLMKYLIHEGPKYAFIDTEDESINLDGGGTPKLVDIRTYKEKVLDYLFENIDNPTIVKIKNIEQLDETDYKNLEDILWVQTGTKDDYYKISKIDNLAVFIRSIVGIEQTAVNEKFGEYLNDNYLTSEQQEFIYSIINYVRENGDIEINNILEESPFNNYTILDLFGNKVPVVSEVVNTIHNCIEI